MIYSVQAEQNRTTSGNWQDFLPHRSHVTKLLLSAVDSTGPTLCILGAGNCNDVDLHALSRKFDKISLVDLDQIALENALVRQNIRTNKLEVFGGIDVTGVGRHIAGWTPADPPSDDEIDECVSIAQRVQIEDQIGRYQVTVSACLLSQIIDTLALTLGAGHPRFIEVMGIIRKKHLYQLAQLTEPGGVVVLISDIVSSDSLPELQTICLNDLPSLLEQAIGEHNFFTGLNPFVIYNLILEDASLKAILCDAVLSQPWIWNLGIRSYAVCSIVARRS